MRVAARDTRDRNGAGPEPFPRAVLNIASEINTWWGLGKLRKDFAFLPLPAAGLIRIISRDEVCVWETLAGWSCVTSRCRASWLPKYAKAYFACLVACIYTDICWLPQVPSAPSSSVFPAWWRDRKELCVEPWRRACARLGSSARGAAISARGCASRAHPSP